MPRAQNAHAYVNAGFKIKLGNKDTMTVSEASIVYGGIRRNFVSFLLDFMKLLIVDDFN